MAGFVAFLVDLTRHSITNTLGYTAFLTFALLPFGAIILNTVRQLLPSDPSHPPEVFHIVPFIGSAIPYGKNPLDFLLRCKEKYGNVFTFTLLGRKITTVLGPKGNNYVLHDEHGSFSAAQVYNSFTKPVFGRDVVFDVPDDVFMEQKKFLKICLSVENFRLYAGMIEDEVECLLKKDPSFLSYQMNDIKNWASFDAKHMMNQVMMLTASRTLQGPEVYHNLDKSFAKLFNDLDGGFTSLHFLFPHLPLESYRKRDEAQKKMSEFYMNIIRKRRQSGEDAQDMISTLMSQKYRDGKPLPSHVIAHLMISILFAGHVMSSSVGSWVLLRIAQNPKVQTELYQEQVENFRELDGSFRSMTYEQIRDLPVLNSVIQETLRRHPPLQSLLRYVIDDASVPPDLGTSSRGDTFVIPRGHHVLACTLLPQLDSKMWHDAHSWDPARWTDPTGFSTQAAGALLSQHSEFGSLTSKNLDNAYLPFGSGRHRCLGEQFAYLQLKAVLAMLIRHLEFKLDQHFPEDNLNGFVMVPKKPCDVSFRRRHLDA